MDNHTSLTATELAVCQQMGITPEAYQQANSDGGDSQELEMLIAAGRQDGRIHGPQTEAWLRQQGVAACRSYLDKQPGTSAQALKNGLTDTELAVCRSMGLSPEAYRNANTSKNH
ncbi:hypothetical protein [Halomonas sp.]|uniref:hypothetical protein n=1 Tax=Halomonas sp. TaxID=1486246 RepID=UPI003F93F67B